VSAATPTPWYRRRALWILLALAALSQTLIVTQQLASDPLAHTPVNDARVYWQWAGEISQGKLVGDTPFLSAPLYPYLLAIVRACGGDLKAVYIAQAALHLLTIALLYKIAERRFGFASAIVGCALYVLLLEPAYYSARILNNTLQLLVVVALWDRMVAVEDDPRTGRVVGLGAVLGLNVLANPTMLAAIPLVALWILWLLGGSGMRQAVLAGAVAVVVVAPATLHNWLACREIIPVSAHGGVTFYHGNAPGADGTYHGIPGIAENRIQQNVDAVRLYAAETGGSWNKTSSLFFKKGLDYWASDPTAALALFGKKAWYFVSGRNYADIYVPEFERKDGIASRLALAPLPTAWITLPALLALVFLARAPRRNFPELLLVLAPLITVATFWYSPRYRMPAVPLLAALAGSVLATLPVLLRDPDGRIRGILGGLAFLVSIGSGGWNEAHDFDSATSIPAQYEYLVGGVLVEQGRYVEAEPRFRASLAEGYAPAQAALADLFRRQGRGGEALSALRETVRAQPSNSAAHRGLAVALAEDQQFPEAEKEFRAAIALDPNDWESLTGLGNVLDATKRPEEAIAQHRAALDRNPSYAPAHYNLGCVLYKQRNLDEAAREFRDAVKSDPKFAQARWYLADILMQQGDPNGAIEILRDGLKLAPDAQMLQDKIRDIQKRSKGQ
jgi:tetratricopeptide (TPR) repeat protein